VRARWLDTLFLLPIAAITWNTVRFAPGPVDTTWYDLLIGVFIAAFLLDRLRRRDSRITTQAATLAGFCLCFLAVYLAGFFDLSSHDAYVFWTKGVIVWLGHSLFLICGVAHLARRGPALYLRAIKWFTAGVAICAAYGVVQLFCQAVLGINLDKWVVGTLTLGQGKVTGINVYGQVGGTQNIYRINALTGDPNHLGVMLCVPLMLLLPVYLADRKGRRRLGLLLAFLFLVQVLTLSRSAALGDIVGLIVLLPIVRTILPSAKVIAISLATVIGAFLVLYAASPFVQTVVRSRTQTGGRGTEVHLAFYQLVPQALDPHPLFGMGFNTYAVFYEFVTGRTDFSPHSFWIATLVETGIVGLTVYLAYLGYVTLCALAMRRSLDPLAARLGAGFTAALAATVAANFFYLTMQFAYFFAIVILIVSGSLLYAPARVAQRREVAPAPGTLAT